MKPELLPFIENARQGNAEALGLLMEQYRNYLKLLAKAQIGKQLQGKVDASDVVQEAFIDVHRYIGNFRGTSEPQFVHWLREVLAGTLANTIRRFLGTKARDIRMERAMAADLNQSTYSLGFLVSDGNPSPSQNVMAEEQAVRVAEAISQLPEEHQNVIIMRHMEGLTFPQIAQRMERSVDSVEKLWLRGITKLKKLFQGEV